MNKARAGTGFVVVYRFEGVLKDVLAYLGGRLAKELAHEPLLGGLRLVKLQHRPIAHLNAQASHAQAAGGRRRAAAKSRNGLSSGPHRNSGGAGGF